MKIENIFLGILWLIIVVVIIICLVNDDKK